MTPVVNANCQHTKAGQCPRELRLCWSSFVVPSPTVLIDCSIPTTRAPARPSTDFCVRQTRRRESFISISGASRARVFKIFTTDLSIWQWPRARTSTARWVWPKLSGTDTSTLSMAYDLDDPSTHIANARTIMGVSSMAQ